ncbi:hypothetical protein B0H15DRAFT_952899 [Mycena belliarum]|uniref:Uncharacterized protein n=1 Tax=Mycena belliarum TaxID=1033014 RepID=A0AAD6U0I8_9AGAR|nr:hypothetical protein B0H15DRAFT_952899 [Mycena belliae]
MYCPSDTAGILLLALLIPRLAKLTLSQLLLQFQARRPSALGRSFASPPVAIQLLGAPLSRARRHPKPRRQLRLMRPMPRYASRAVRARARDVRKAGSQRLARSSADTAQLSWSSDTCTAVCRILQLRSRARPGIGRLEGGRARLARCRAVYPAPSERARPTFGVSRGRPTRGINPYLHAPAPDCNSLYVRARAFFVVDGESDTQALSFGISGHGDGRRCARDASAPVPKRTPPVAYRRPTTALAVLH